MDSSSTKYYITKRCIKLKLLRQKSILLASHDILVELASKSFYKESLRFHCHTNILAIDPFLGVICPGFYIGVVLSQSATIAL